MKKYLVTGGSGFIGSTFIKSILEKGDKVLNFDLLTYAATKKTLNNYEKNKNYFFIKGDIVNYKKIDKILNKYRPDFVVNFAAETHVDRSIDNPNDFINTNILGVFNLLNSVYKFWLKIKKKNSFRFIQVSTDEVYGSVIRGSSNEKSFLDPSSPYSASKTSADHLVLSFFKTYNFPSIIVRPSNNYGPYQFPEKLIPLIIINAIEEKILPVYGNGKQIRNWLYVEDTTTGIKKIVSNGKNGNIYNIGGNSEITNIELVRKICSFLQTFFPRTGNETYFNLIKFVENRPGHDQRYSLDSKKIRKITGWKPAINFNTGLENTIKWYLKNKKWWGPMRKFKYKGERLGRKK